MLQFPLTKDGMPIDDSILSLYFAPIPLICLFPALYFPIVTNYKAPACKIQVRTENLEFPEFETSLIYIVRSRQPGLWRDPVSVPHTHSHKEEVKFAFANRRISCTMYSQLSTYHKTLSMREH